MGGDEVRQHLFNLALTGVGMYAVAAGASGPVASRSIVNAPTGTSRQIHLTNAKGKAGILSSGRLMGNRGIFAVPESVAGESTALKVMRTGLMPGETTNFVRVPQAATGMFQQPVPIGPYSAWKYFGGVRYAPPGSVNMTTGAFTPGPALIGPKALIYGPDVLFWGGVGTAGGIYFYGESQQGGN